MGAPNLAKAVIYDRKMFYEICRFSSEIPRSEPDVVGPGKCCGFSRNLDLNGARDDDVLVVRAVPARENFIPEICGNYFSAVEAVDGHIVGGHGTSAS